MRMRLVKCDYILLGFGLFFLLFGIVTWIIFPILYKQGVQSVSKMFLVRQADFQALQFKQHNDKSLNKAAWQWSHPPMTNIMSFYFFNVTNPDEILYEGAKPALVEVKT